MHEKIGGILLPIAIAFSLFIFSPILSFVLLFFLKTNVYVYMYSFDCCFLQYCSKQSKVIVRVAHHLSVWLRKFPMKNRWFFHHNIPLDFTIHWKTSQLNRFPFFSFVLKWHAEKFLVDWLWNIVIGGCARKWGLFLFFLFKKALNKCRKSETKLLFYWNNWSEKLFDAASAFLFGINKFHF